MSALGCADTPAARTKSGSSCTTSGMDIAANSLSSAYRGARQRGQIKQRQRELSPLGHIPSATSSIANAQTRQLLHGKV